MKDTTEREKAKAEFVENYIKTLNDMANLSMSILGICSACLQAGSCMIEFLQAMEKTKSSDIK